MEIETISAETDITDKMSVDTAKKKLEKVNDYELHFFLVQRDTFSATTNATRKKITLAQMEYDRRATLSAKKTSITANLISAGIGVVGVILGLLLSAYFKPDQPNQWQVKFTPAAVEQTVVATPIRE